MQTHMYMSTAILALTFDCEALQLCTEDAVFVGPNLLCLRVISFA